MSRELARYETLASLFQKRFGFLAPGKDGKFERVSLQEKTTAWDEWRISRLSETDALDEIIQLTADVEEQSEEIERLEEEISELKKRPQ